ncbi:luciferin 4-monooxygenase-like isoform X3 [Anoplolepis gracilipes]|uniref:luciferin 4-monooxygenase-like isoform X3 n=1 Tax=Anoplolepis gracilipes TaxID=354296 RepID=UPI003B9E2E8E
MSRNKQITTGKICAQYDVSLEEDKENKPSRNSTTGKICAQNDVSLEEDKENKPPRNSSTGKICAQNDVSLEEDKENKPSRNSTTEEICAQNDVSLEEDKENKPSRNSTTEEICAQNDVSLEEDKENKPSRNSTTEEICAQNDVSLEEDKENKPSRNSTTEEICAQNDVSLEEDKENKPSRNSTTEEICAQNDVSLEEDKENKPSRNSTTEEICAQNDVSLEEDKENKPSRNSTTEEICAQNDVSLEEDKENKPSRNSTTEKDVSLEEDKENKPSRNSVNNVLVGESCPHCYVNLGDFILSAFACNPELIGQIDAETGEEVTFQQMKENSVKLALWINDQGFQQNSVLTICTHNKMQAYVPLLAGIYLNFVVTPWDTEYLKDSIRTLYFLMEHNPDIIFIDAEDVVKLETALIFTRHCDQPVRAKIIVVNKKEQSKYTSLDSILNSKVDQQKIEMFTCLKQSEKKRAVVMFSSNTATYPGHVHVPYGAFTAPSNEYTPTMRPKDVGLWYEPLNWTHSLLLTIRSILWYVTAIKSSTFNEENLFQIVEKYKVKWVFLKSNMCNKLTNTNVCKKYNISSLKQVLFGDTSIKYEVHENLIKSLPNVSIIQVYGLSETGVITYQRNSNKIGSSGCASKNVKLMFIDFKTRLPVGPNTHGEIWCRTPIVAVFDAIKALESKEDTKRTIEGWYYTEDIGYYDEDGDIFVIGKLKDMIKYKDMYILSTKIEEVLKCHSAVSEAAVIAVPDIYDGQIPKAFVTIMPEAKVTKEELMDFVEDNLDSNYALRGGIKFLVDKMPYLPNGRIDRIRVPHICSK